MSADQAKKQADCKPTFVNFILLHGILMVLSWGFFLQWGAFIARYFRHKDPTWFHLHRFFQVSCCNQMVQNFCSIIVEFSSLGLNCAVCCRHCLQVTGYIFLTSPNHVGHWKFVDLESKYASPLILFHLYSTKTQWGFWT